MLFQTTAVIALLASAAEAHFRIPFPGERNASNYDTQTESPCGGSNDVVLPRFQWNPDGSPLDTKMGHNGSVAAVYLCAEDECTTEDDFDVLVDDWSLLYAGNYCIESLQLPDEYNDVGTNLTLEIIYVAINAGSEKTNNGEKYKYFYNCLDIEVSDDGPTWDGTQCYNTTDDDPEYDSNLASQLESTRLDEIETISFVDENNGITVIDDSSNATTTSNSTGSATASGSESGSATATGSSSASSSAAAAQKYIVDGSAIGLAGFVAAALMM